MSSWTHTLAAFLTIGLTAHSAFSEASPPEAISDVASPVKISSPDVGPGPGVQIPNLHIPYVMNRAGSPGGCLALAYAET